MAINRTRFFDSVRPSLFKGSLSQSQVDGMSFMLDVFERQYNWSDLRWLAYAFATAYHETAFTMMPIKEYGSESYLKGKAYYPYFGRGYVQLTWEDNYREMGSKLGVNLMGANMDKALQPDLAAEIMYVGMRDGDFTGKKLATYFSETTNDPVNARRIINGTDKAQTIADYYNKFLKALRDAHVEDPVVPPTPQPDEGKYVTRAEFNKLLADMATVLTNAKLEL